MLLVLGQPHGAFALHGASVVVHGAFVVQQQDGLLGKQPQGELGGASAHPEEQLGEQTGEQLDGLTEDAFPLRSLPNTTVRRLGSGSGSASGSGFGSGSASGSGSGSGSAAASGSGSA